MRQIQCYDTFESFTGPVTVVMENERLVRIMLLPGEWEQYRERSRVALVQDPVVLREAVIQLQEYFQGIRYVFSLPLSLDGPPFTRQVWQAVFGIPYGQVRSYADIALTTGNPTAYRAVGQANRRNPLPIVIPCHRVIGKNGNLVGYGGGYTDIKRLLLDHEKKYRVSSDHQEP